MKANGQNQQSAISNLKVLALGSESRGSWFVICGSSEKLKGQKEKKTKRRKDKGTKSKISNHKILTLGSWMCGVWCVVRGMKRQRDKKTKNSKCTSLI